MTANADENKFTIIIPAGFTNARHNATASFTTALLLFFLPFLTIKCNSVQLASATGVQIATGFKIEPGKDIEEIGKGIFDQSQKKHSEKIDSTAKDNDEQTPGNSYPNNNSFTEGKNKMAKTLQPNYFMAAAFIAGFLGLIFSLIPFRQRWIICAIAGWIGIGSFLITLFTIYEQTQEYNVDLGMISVSASFTLWFFLSFAGFLAATLFSHKHRSLEWSREKQKEIDEFITATGYSGAENSANNNTG